MRRKRVASKPKLICKVEKSNFHHVGNKKYLPTYYYGTESGQVWAITAGNYLYAAKEMKDKPYYFVRHLKEIMYDYKSEQIVIQDVKTYLENYNQEEKTLKMVETFEEAKDLLDRYLNSRTP